VVTAQNGVPWWYFHGIAGPFAEHRIASVDPDGRLWDRIGPERAIGCIVYPAAEIDAPGTVRHIDGDRFTLGEPSGESTARIGALAQALVKAGFKAPIRPRIRDEIWVKLWGNLSFNPVSALTGATLEQIAADDETRALVRAMMLEGQAIGEALGVRFPVDVDKRIAGAAAVGAHKTSMLQDLERGRPMEIDALVGSVQELGRLTGKPTPTIDAVLALVRARASLAGCYSRPINHEKKGG
jgi:2-dehydropantoate 2-reductase